MYTGYTALLIVFLTHPGIVIPIPGPGLPGSWLRGLFQASWTMVMQSFSEGSRSYMASMVYWVVLYMWGYIYIAIALAEAKT
jgi:hypothetical protein